MKIDGPGCVGVVLAVASIVLVAYGLLYLANLAYPFDTSKDGPWPENYPGE